MPKILLVEDDYNLREIFEMRLKAEGYDTLTAGDGEEALDVAMKQKPDLIIADVMMPKLSGFEMLESLRAVPEMAATKAVMMTALGQAEDRARGERLGVLKYLVKSQVTLEDFVRVVRGILSPDAAATGAPAVAEAPTNSSPIKTNQESEQAMQDDSNPAAGAPAPAPSDSAAPAMPAGDSQQSTDQEQQAVQDQINSFVNQPGGDAAAGGVAAAPSPADDSGTATEGAADAPAADSGMGMADTAAPADMSGSQPPADTGPAEAPAAPSEPPASSDTTGQV